MEDKTQNIVYVAEHRTEILAKSAGKSVTCPTCEKSHFSPFDKLFIAAYGKCIFDVVDDEELKLMGENIFAIL